VASLDALLDPVLDAAYGLALRLTRDRADAEDLVQDAVLQALKGFGTFDQQLPFKPWFFRVLVNCYRGRHRKSTREVATLPLEDASELYLFERTAGLGWHGGPDDPAVTFMDRMTAEAVGAALDALPESYRVVAVLYFYQDLSYAAIAEQLGIPVGTVRSRLHRARAMLQRRLWQIAEESGLIDRAAAGGES
jgi:RNA polymerase sigma-70 factor (ECF subfamily)